MVTTSPDKRRISAMAPRLLIALSCTTLFCDVATATVTTSTRTKTFTGTGAKGPFTINFPFLEASHIQVRWYVTAAPGTAGTFVQNVDYTVKMPVGNVQGSITTTANTSAAKTYVIERIIPIRQETSLRSQGQFVPKTHENALDKLTMIAQQLNDGAVTGDASGAVATHIGAADDHPQYFLLAGRAGGQVGYGGTQNGENLTLGSTAGGVKGKIVFGTSAYDETVNFLGLGHSSPAYNLDVHGDSGFGSSTPTLISDDGFIWKDANTGSLVLSGSGGLPTSGGGTAGAIIYGSAHATHPNKAWLYASQLILADETGTTRATLSSSALTLSSSIDLVVDQAKVAYVPELRGSTTSADTLTLKSTSHGTKGRILFGTSAYDDQNNQLGIGDATPNATAPGIELVVAGQGQFSSYVTQLRKPVTTEAPGHTMTMASGCNAVYFENGNNSTLTLPNSTGSDGDSGCEITYIVRSSGNAVYIVPGTDDAILGQCLVPDMTSAAGNTTLAAMTNGSYKFSGTINKYITVAATVGGEAITLVLDGKNNRWYSTSCMGKWTSQP